MANNVKMHGWKEHKVSTKTLCKILKSSYRTWGTEETPTMGSFNAYNFHPINCDKPESVIFFIFYWLVITSDFNTSNLFVQNNLYTKINVGNI